MRDKAFVLLPLAAMGLMALASQSQADVYKYLTPEGTPLFTNAPMDAPGYQLLWHKGSLEPNMVVSSITMGGRHEVIKAPGTKSDGVSGSSKARREEFRTLIETAAAKVRLQPDLLHAVILAESGYNPRAISRAGAQGLMQLIPATAQRYGVTDSFDPQQNVSGGARYLRDLLEMFNFDLALALAGYNAGENAVIRYGYQIPPYPETIDYVRKVLGFYQENRLRSSALVQTAQR